MLNLNLNLKDDDYYLSEELAHLYTFPLHENSIPWLLIPSSTVFGEELKLKLGLKLRRCLDQ
jgi:hypothetical protein